MVDELKTGLFGRVQEVMLADGKTYKLREPSIETLEKLDFELSQITSIKNIRKLAFSMLKDDNEITEQAAGKLITISMLQDGSPFLRSFLSVLGVTKELEKNVEAGTGI